MSEFTKDWFSLAEPLLKNILEPYKGQPDLLFLEVGCFEGRSTKWFLENVLTNESSGILCIDTFDGNEEHEDDISMPDVKKRFFDNIRPYKRQCKVLAGRSQDVLRSRDLDGEISVAYIDGSHRASDVLADLVLIYELLRPGGLIICDDFMWNYNRYPSENIPKTAIDSFLLCYKGRVEALQVTWKTIILRKV